MYGITKRHKKNKKCKWVMGNVGKRHEYARMGMNASVMDVWNHEKARKTKSANG
jgi:hypothetical protein